MNMNGEGIREYQSILISITTTASKMISIISIRAPSQSQTTNRNHIRIKAAISNNKFKSAHAILKPCALNSKKKKKRKQKLL
jgi:hypothetical protein